ncbi:MAG: SHOCT domain-containing protein [Gaiellaceae bacterium]
MTFGAVLAGIMSGFLVGGAARFLLPGPDPMPFWLTVGFGLLGSAIGGGIAAAIFGAHHTVDTPGRIFALIMLEIGSAAMLVALYRRFVQKRPLSGPGAYRFPERGVGIARLRARFHQLGLDPDRIGHRGQAAKAPRELTGEEVAAELERLRRQRDEGSLSDEEYERARERLRRY